MLTVARFGPAHPDKNSDSKSGGLYMLLPDEVAQTFYQSQDWTLAF